MSEQKLLTLAQTAIKLSEQYIPKVNHAKSFMNAEAFAALNEFEAAVSAYKREQAEAIAALAALNELEAEFTCELEQSK